MDEREKVCILCGKKEIMLGYICRGCQDRIQVRAVDQRQQMLKQANEGSDLESQDDAEPKG